MRRYINQSVKEKALDLRKDGASYSDISKQTGVSKATLSTWFSKKGVSPETYTKNKLENLEINKARLKIINEARYEKLQKYYQQAKEEARVEYKENIKDQLFLAGIVAYWGEGDRVSKYNLRIANSDPGIILIFKRFLVKFLKVEELKIRAQIFYYEDLFEDICKEYWSLNLKVDKGHFNKSILLSSKHKTRKSRYGSCNLGITSRFLKTKMLEWITIFDREMRKNATMV